MVHEEYVPLPAIYVELISKSVPEYTVIKPSM
jgi:hypothetical protein